MNGSDGEAGKAAVTAEEATAPSELPAGAGAQTVYADEPAAPAKARPAPPPALLFVVLGVLGIVGLGVFLAARSKSAAAPQPFQDLGAGISNATGLRGSLQARWQGNAAQYQIKFEPIDPLQSAGFSYVVANPPAPLSIHVKLLDATGFAVCGKDILFPFDAGSTDEQSRERGQDVFQSVLGDDGKVAAVTAQGSLPCTPGQYKQIVYWDLTTNFPTLAEQDDLMNHTAELKAKQEAQKRAALQRKKTPRSAYYTEGDDKATGFDAARRILQTGLGRSLLVSGAGQATAAAWAANGALFHYRCDQRSHCVLTHAGGASSLSVSVLQ